MGSSSDGGDGHEKQHRQTTLKTQLKLFDKKRICVFKCSEHEKNDYV